MKTINPSWIEILYNFDEIPTTSVYFRYSALPRFKIIHKERLLAVIRLLYVNSPTIELFSGVETSEKEQAKDGTV